jgi:hypothetical protein
VKKRASLNIESKACGSSVKYWRNNRRKGRCGETEGENEEAENRRSGVSKCWRINQRNAVSAKIMAKKA